MSSRPTAQDLHSPPRRPREDRRGSPSYERYDQPPHSHSHHDSHSNGYDRGHSHNGPRWTEEEREQRAIEREERRGGGRQRLTPERELGYGGRYGQQPQGQGHQGGQGPQRGGYNDRGGGGRGDDWIDSRRKERENSGISIWPPSPRTPEPEDKGRSSKSKSSKHRSSSSRSKHGKSSSSSSRHKSSSSSRHRRKYSDDSESDSSSSSSDDDRKKKRSRHKSSRSSKKRSLSPLSEEEERSVSKRRHSEAPPAVEEEVGEEEWVEKSPEHDLNSDNDDQEVGPLPLGGLNAKGGARNAYGGALRPGEGSAMAAYVSSDQRIPRRGEIGMESDQIEKFEQVGYVMSGSRHRRMNAVRVRKENQVISAEEKRGILQLAAQEKVKRENEIVASFRELVDSKLSQK
ncbi:NKAP family protein [Sporobolomyces salmoneus]|uniref:NKAP family protein n=1 Tax=Sporobolomyces salmoneus TaxID=183962 RepID=UPI00316BF61E